MKNNEPKIAIIGLGYVGLPLAVAFGEKYETIGFDIDQSRVSEINQSYDRTNELTATEIKSAEFLKVYDSEASIADCSIYIITVPTPIDTLNQPDLTILKNATELVAKYLSNQDIVIYESTVYPTATDLVCSPILEKISGLKYISGEDSKEDGFYCGYSPERINPGDKNNPLKSIKKIVSGSTPSTLEKISALYSTIIDAGIINAESIEAAEAAKVIENTQRDLNIALINEFALIFNKLSIDTEEVLRLASTKWNFIPMKPGLVGGHCIGVDPYYLAHKAIEIDYYPEIILSGRKLNNSMGKYVAQQALKLMGTRGISTSDSKILILGFSFKENCPDIRNTKVIDIITELKKYNCRVSVFDPNVIEEEVFDQYGIQLVKEEDLGNYDSVIIAVNHDYFKDLGIEKIRSLCNENGIVYDVKYVFDKEDVDGRL